MNNSKIYASILGLSLLFGSIQAQDYSQPVIPLDSVYQTQLPNGLTLLVVEDHQSPRVLTSLFVPSPKDSTKISRFIHHSLPYISKKQPIAEFERRLNKEGMAFRSLPNGIQVFTTEQKVDTALNVIAELIKEAEYSDAKINDLRPNFIPSNGTNNDLAITGNISDQLLQLNFSNDTTTLDSTNCVRLFKKLYQPKQSILIIVGAVTSKAIDATVKKHFSFWKNTPSKVLKRDTSVQQSIITSPKVAAHYSESSELVTLKLLLPLKFTHKWKVAHYIELINTILGGHPQSKFNKALRINKGLSFGLLSRVLWLPSGEGYLSIQGGVESSKVDSAVVNILREVSLIKTQKVRKKELELAQKISTTNYARKLQRTENVVELLHEQWRDSFPTKYYASFSDSLRSINPTSLRKIADQVLQTDSTIIIAVGNEASLKPQLLAISDSTIIEHDQFGLPIPKTNYSIPDGYTAVKVANKYLNAISLGEPVDSIKTISTKWLGEINGSKVELRMKIAKPDKLLIEVLLEGEMLSFTKVNGDRIWAKSQGGTVTETDSMSIRQYRQQALIFPETQFDSTYILKGTEIIRGIPTYRIEAPNGAIYHYAIDKGFKIQSSSIGREGNRINQFFGNYKSVKEIRYPHTVIINGLTGWPLQFSLQEIKINPTFEAQLFDIEGQKN